MAEEAKEQAAEKQAGQPAQQPAPAPPADPVLLVERWWQDWFPNSAVSRDTAAWNRAYQAKEDLIKKLTAISNQQSANPKP